MAGAIVARALDVVSAVTGGGSVSATLMEADR